MLIGNRCPELELCSNVALGVGKQDYYGRLIHPFGDCSDRLQVRVKTVDPGTDIFFSHS
jgi:hypothetical protein